jgi:tetratricopeptide (TPR) repeat protein
MKIKPLYIYLTAFVIFGIAIIIFSSSTKKGELTSPNAQQGQMPNDDIHKGMSSGDAPSKSNVSEEAKQKMAELKAAVDKNPKDTAKVRQYADMLVFHQPDEAEIYYKKILSIDPRRTDLLLQMTLISFNKRDFNKAEKYTDDILKNNPTNATALYNLGAIANAKGDNKKARSMWENVAKKYPNTDGGRVSSNALKQLDLKK